MRCGLVVEPAGGVGCVVLGVAFFGHKYLEARLKNCKEAFYIKNKQNLKWVRFNVTRSSITSITLFANASCTVNNTVKGELSPNFTF